MNELNQPQSSPPNTTGWWIAWITAVIGGPALAAVAALFGQAAEFGQTMAVLMAAALVIGVIAHFVASIGLARRISRRRNPETRTGAAIGLIFGLLFGGWAAMGAVFFVGCLTVMAAS